MTRIILMLFLISGCSGELGGMDSFWYPVKLYHAYCPKFEGEVYLMDHSHGWTSYSVYLSKEDKKEVRLGNACSYKEIRKLPTHEFIRSTHKLRQSLTQEQATNVIEGFR